NEFEDNFKRIMVHWKEKERKDPLLVILIDDLDRCAPDEIAGTLEAIKLFLDVPGCVFVLGFDVNRVATTLQRRSRGDIPDGTEYLKKLIQLNFALPPPQDETLAEFIDQSIDVAGLQNFFEEDVFRKVEGYHKLIIDGTGRNPREIRRFLNAVAVN